MKRKEEGEEEEEERIREKAKTKGASRDDDPASFFPYPFFFAVSTTPIWSTILPIFGPFLPSSINFLLLRTHRENNSCLLL